MPGFMPTDWRGCFMVLLLVFVLSGFLDNIAAAMIGGAVANTVFKGRVHIGYLAAIVAASNAGGAGSVVGDTTTTMMWIAGVHPPGSAGGLHRIRRGAGDLWHAGSLRQHAYQPIDRKTPTPCACRLDACGHRGVHPGGGRGRQRDHQLAFNAISDSFPFLGAAVWVAILDGCRCASRPGACCRVRQGLGSSCCRWCCARR
jgi:hypothetical protein